MEKKIGNKTQEIWEMLLPKINTEVGGPVVVTSTPESAVLTWNGVEATWKPIKFMVNWDHMPSKGLFNKQSIGRGIRKSKRVFNDIDPYGEENWDET